MRGCVFVLLFCRGQSAFQDFVRQRLRFLFLLDPARIFSFSSALTKLWLLNLDPAIPFLLSCYSSLGRPVDWDPVNILRSLVLMTHMHEFSITKWVLKLRADKVLAILSGFEPGETPGVGSFYDFLHHVWRQDQKTIRKRRAKLRPVKRKPRKKFKPGQKLRPKHPGVVKKLVERALLGRCFSRRPERIIQEIFARCFVDQSVDLGLIPDPLALIVSGDGTPTRTGSNPSGVKVCDCKKQGMRHCGCPRRFFDPDANWGWDSYREIYYYGYTLYTLTDPCSGLPVFSTLAQASRHDSVLGVVALAQFRELYPYLAVIKGIWDSAHDVHDFYILHNRWDIEPFIALNTKSTGQLRLAPLMEITGEGIPRCPAGALMAYAGFDQTRSRLKWRCPMVAGNSLVKETVNCTEPCSPSAYGRTVHTKPEDDLRLFPKTPRDSLAWKYTYNKRSSSERLNKRSKIDYSLERCRVKSKEGWFWRSHLADMNQHLDAWLRDAADKGFDVWSEVLDLTATA